MYSILHTRYPRSYVICRCFVPELNVVISYFLPVALLNHITSYEYGHVHEPVNPFRYVSVPFLNLALLLL